MSWLFLGQHGIRIPQLSVLASVAATEPMPEVFAGNAADDDFAFRRRADGAIPSLPARGTTSSSGGTPFIASASICLC